MTEQEIKDIVTRQRKYFYTGATLPVNTRLAALQKLYNAISGHETEIHDALKKDLGKSGFESYNVRNRPGAGRDQLYAEAYETFCRRKNSPDTSGHSSTPGAIRSRRRMG